MDNVRRADGHHEALQLPETIPNPTRVWTDAEIDALRCGYRPTDMDDKWFAFMEADRLYLHRSQTGLGVYEAQFSPLSGGHMITDAVVTGDGEQYRRGPDDAETDRLERLISRVLLGESMLGREFEMHPVTPNVQNRGVATVQREPVVGDDNRGLGGCEPGDARSRSRG